MAKMAEQAAASDKMKGQASASFNYENAKGGTTKLEDFKGKYVYVDVWATWCGPCRKEIPFLKQVEEKYHGKKIEFVSISVDTAKDHDKWKKMVTDQSLGGVQLFADKDWGSAFVQSYGINSIPRFILIGPDGKIVDADAKRPSDPALQAQLDTLLK
jgi:thiol-disulfide isomerase/thioredoxin